MCLAGLIYIISIKKGREGKREERMEDQRVGEWEGGSEGGRKEVSLPSILASAIGHCVWTEFVRFQRIKLV